MKIIKPWCILFSLSFLLVILASSGCQPNRKQGLIVLTFDDAVKSHRSFVAPLLKEYGFGATFFVTHRWMNDTVNFMNWEEIEEIHQMGFEIGNHSWSHIDFASPKAAARLEGELGLIDLHLGWQGIPKPVSFAWCGNGFGPEALAKLKELGYKFARRGMQPEIAYGKKEIGPVYQPDKHHSLLIPSAGDAYPEWTFDHFREVVDREGIVVLQFHGVPDDTHPWVHTDPEFFKQCMDYLAENDFDVIAMRDLEQYLPEKQPADHFLSQRYSPAKDLNLDPPTEVQATQKNLEMWLSNMLRHHQFDEAEAELVTGMDKSKWPKPTVGVEPNLAWERSTIKVLPYPGGRHPRIGFLDGAMDPLRGTKLSVFMPWDTTEYVVVDLPEAIFSQNGLEFLAHTHFPTIYDYQHLTIENSDWQWQDGSWVNSWQMPNNLRFGATATPRPNQVDLGLWIENGTGEDLDSLITQVCVMLKGSNGLNDLTNDNKRIGENTIATRTDDGEHWVFIRWENPHRLWGNTDVPCMHVDPRFAACKPGERVTLSGKLWFGHEEDVLDLKPL